MLLACPFDGAPVDSPAVQAPPDPSPFFRLNEEVARELTRLEASGALDGLRGLLGAAGAELWVTSARPADGLEELVGILRPGPGGWDPAGVLATRSRFVVTYPDGATREVYMPDHICPSCWNDQDNVISDATRRCARCAFAW